MATVNAIGIRLINPAITEPRSSETISQDARIEVPRLVIWLMAMRENMLDETSVDPTISARVVPVK